GAQPFLAQHIGAFAPADDTLIWCEAIVRVQHRYGERKNRSRARMKYVVKKLGIDGFRRLVSEEVRRVEAERGDELRTEVRDEAAAHAVPPSASAPPPPATPPPRFQHLPRPNARPPPQEGFVAAPTPPPPG